MVQGVKDYKERFLAEEARANQLEAKLKALADAVKEDRENKRRDIDQLNKDKQELEERAATAENALIKYVDVVKQDKARYEEALNEERFKTTEAERKINFLQEKLDRLVQLTKKQQDNETINKIATLEQEATKYQNQITQIKLELEHEKGRSRKVLAEEQEKAKRSEQQVNQLQQNLVEALDKLQALEEKTESERKTAGKSAAQNEALTTQLKQVNKLKLVNEGTKTGRHDSCRPVFVPFFTNFKKYLRKSVERKIFFKKFHMKYHVTSLYLIFSRNVHGIVMSSRHNFPFNKRKRNFKMQTEEQTPSKLSFVNKKRK